MANSPVALKVALFKIELPEKDVELLKFLQRHYKNVRFVINEDALSVVDGSVTFDFDHNGVITCITKTIKKRRGLDRF